jgi:hypothetical protein
MSALVMTTNMTIGMSLWMRYRRHRWVSVAEMAAAMHLPFAVMLVAFWAGVLPGHVIMIGGRVLRLPAMVAAMLHRRDEYVRVRKEDRNSGRGRARTLRLARGAPLNVRRVRVASTAASPVESQVLVC